MAKNLNDVLAALPPKRRAKVEQRAGELATLKDLRLAVAHTQQDLAASLGVGQDTISRIERRSDLLLSTLRRYVEAMGGELDLVARFPNRPPVLLDNIAQQPPVKKRAASAKRIGTRHKALA
ncbi:MAG: helix-turn-helix domain-containing protein [Pseudomonadota bacterium]